MASKAMEKVQKVLTVFKSLEEQARAEIGKLNAAREKLHLQRSEAESELATLRQALPDLELDHMLGEVDSTPQRQRIRDLTTAIEAAGGALTALAPRLRVAHAALRQCRADALLRQADEVAKRREANFEKFVIALQELEAVADATFVSNATYNRDVFNAMAAHGNSILPNFGPVQPPKHERMLLEEQAIREAARQLLKQPVREAGQVQADTLETLLADLAGQVKAADLLIAPSEAEVRAYFAPARIQAAEAAWSASFESKVANRSGGGSSPAPFIMRHVLVWANGRIDPAASRVACEPAPEKWRTGPLSEREPAGAAYGT